MNFDEIKFFFEKKNFDSMEIKNFNIPAPISRRNRCHYLMEKNDAMGIAGIPFIDYAKD